MYLVTHKKHVIAAYEKECGWKNWVVAKPGLVDAELVMVMAEVEFLSARQHQISRHKIRFEDLARHIRKSGKNILVHEGGQRSLIH